ncbi:hypothetical protein AB0F52_47505 [Amycolatopsis sp. NPDC024027]|uniref:hypothetical protein n=1 Tax=Amycolatopsis sp. NPDC024027 TaxID=3154327 RepID=UPI0034098C63
MEGESKTPETLLRWIIDRVGGVRQLARHAEVSVDTLRRWQRPDGFPRNRLTPNVEAVNSWACRNAPGEDPSEGYPVEGLRAFIAHDQELDGDAGRRRRVGDHEVECPEMANEIHEVVTEAHRPAM